MASVEQASRDIQRKLQKLERLQDKTLREILQVVEKVYNNREAEKEREEWKEKERDEKELR